MSRLAKNSIAAGLTTLLVTTGLSFSAVGAEGDIAQSNASAVTATGLTEIVDSDQCTAESPDGEPVDGSGTCGDGLSTSGVSAFSQNASTGLDGQNGTSQANASVAPINIDALTTIDLSTAAEDIEAIDTGTILDGILGDTGSLPILGDLLDELLDPLLTAIQTNALGPVLAQIQDTIPVSVQIDAVNSQCTVTAGSDPSASSTVAGIDILVTLAPDNVITIPIVAETSENVDLVGSIAPQQIVNGILDGVRTTLTESLNGAVAGTDVAAGQVQAIVNQVLDPVGEALLDPLGGALIPVLDATVNEQIVGDGGSVEATALDLSLIGGDGATLELARSECGPNGVLAVDNDDTNAAADANADADADANADANADATPVVNPTPAPVAGSIADADSQADADVQASLPNAGAPNLLPFFLLGIALLAFGLAVLLNERRRLGLASMDDLA